MRINSRKSKGLTLIELLIYVGLVAILTIGIYSTYSKKLAESNSVKQVQYLEQIDAAVQNFVKSNANLAVVTPANLIASNAIPQEMVNGLNIRNVFGGNVTFGVTTIVNPNDAIRTTLASIPISVCARIASSNVGVQSNRVLINGNVVRNIGADFDGAVLTNIAANCNLANNTINFDKIAEREPFVVGPGGAIFTTLPQIRNKEDPYYIANIGDTVTSPPVVCAAGTTWTGAFCSCPANTSWNGRACIAHNDATVPGACPLGQGWNNAGVCAPLPNGVNAVEAYVDNRRLSTAISGVPKVRTVPENPALCTAPGSFYDGRSCQVCALGAWNGFRCVTP